ncbi:metal-dependent phosphohydrolase [Centipeda periodontii DSM 2778]|uniref:Metal-dependent phosphohydrolase n=1 Tax=Centipeda periodontii DSM 2778 TaxID=888060 RepID=F5RKV5_9FIRM|nr:HD domain-containing protein [Centipeda periodontii]EGK60858.1 metal-dependent phosphohydrolase [Centipeda periodontii DSM 2778]
MERYRDPVHGFIEVRPLEKKIIDSAPFQRLRHIKQLAMTNLVFHGAEHTRFGHSLGVMHLVTKAFRMAVENGSEEYPFSSAKKEWYEQILRLIALTHDLGHAPFSHASESVFPDGVEHEDFTEKIVKQTSIAEHISNIGNEFKEQYGEAYAITSELICDIYRGRISGINSEFTFLKSFMDGELDCDKMDYLLRDSLYCGVNYGKYDLDRLLASLTIDGKDGFPRLAIDYGGLKVFEEFVLARYFMFTEVYFHRTRRYFDIVLGKALQQILPNGKYPKKISSYLKWDDVRVLQECRKKMSKDEYCRYIVERYVYPCVYETSAHAVGDSLELYKGMKGLLHKDFEKNLFIEDTSADKMPHKIPVQSSIEDEKAVVLLNKRMGKRVSISDESHIIRALANKIGIRRLYAHPDIAEQARTVVRNWYNPHEEEAQ